ncbi:vitellogenin-1-like [Contarinia nasturtii]|uniref:vitellogenin-1-like n=1 Tax=Contarinia nasturtii TaxID=265458 RepID=UPI0012D403B8|nr:vitellogenin-1-like [Contarinia nasturtii]
MRFFAYLTVLLFISHDGYCVEFHMSDVFSVLTHATVGALESIPRSIPSPSKFFELSKNVLIGFPYEIAYALINDFCSAALNSNSVFVKAKFTPKIESMSFILRTKDAHISIPINNPNALWNHTEFNSSNPLTIFVTGWKTNLKHDVSTAQDTMSAAYLCRGNVNFVTLDTAAYIDTLYSWSAFNTETIGECLSNALQSLITRYPLEKIHLIGHSLGAQICGAAGRHFTTNTKRWIPRITGLDPANPCFNNGEALSGLFRGDAQYVDVIHTNPGCLGKREAVGDADFYCNGMSPLQPGSFDVSSSHSRAWQYYAESVYPGQESNFLAKECTSMQAFETNCCHGPWISMGYATPTHVKGKYFLKTHSKSPYGENSRKYYQPVCVN